MSDPRYPIGPFTPPDDAVTAAERSGWIDRIAATPAALRAAVAGLSDAQLDTPYRDGGWTVRQLCHHVPDSHLNAYVRFKLGLTEEQPEVRPYDEKRWAELPDCAGPIAVSLALLDALHERWVGLLRSLPEEAWQRSIRHPEWGVLRLDTVLAQYAWHGDHHVAHVTELRRRRGW
jgi:hypothetical protein